MSEIAPCPNCGSDGYAVTCMGFMSQNPEDDPNWIRCGCGFRNKMTVGQLLTLTRLEREAGLTPRHKIPALVVPAPAPQPDALREAATELLRAIDGDVPRSMNLYKNCVDKLRAALTTPQPAPESKGEGQAPLANEVSAVSLGEPLQDPEKAFTEWWNTWASKQKWAVVPAIAAHEAWIDGRAIRPEDFGAIPDGTSNG